MMALDRLDQEMDRWEHELLELEEKLDPGTQKQMATLADKMQALKTERMSLEQLIEHGRMAESTEMPMLPQLRAILFWAREFAERAEDYAARYHDYLEKLLWLNLLRGRLLGYKKPFDLDIAEQDVQQMLKRKQSLEKTEEHLQAEKAGMKSREQELRKRYEAFHFEEVGRQAAQSFAPATFSAGGQKMAFEAFGRLLRTLAAHSAHETPQVKKIQKMTVTFTRRSQTLMEQCSELLRQGMSSEGSQRRKSIRQMQQNLSEMERLESEIDTTLTLLSAGSGKRQPSFIVKKVSKQAKTIRLSHTD